MTGADFVVSQKSQNDLGKLKLGFMLPRIVFFEHRKKRKTQKSKLKLGKTLAELADFTINFPLLSTLNYKLSTFNNL